ncbi:MAG TPA: ribosome small subunit-dependent GTPase A [Cyclobacteriaceae bacterium]|nr:ribosome small subunit-dependent GTPase A [Cyclobacteriaceae bacterium]
MNKGRVLKSTGSWYEVLNEKGERINCRLRGKIRLEELSLTNPIAVGDFVSFEMQHNEGVIQDILPRKNYIVRQSVKKSKQKHILAANLDQAILVITLVYPRTSTGFIDRFLAIAESYSIPQVLIFNKSDILDNELKAEQQKLIDLYESIGVKCISVSAIQDDLRAISSLLKGKVSLLSGHSGVGKSTIINKLAPHISQKVEEVSDFSMKGKHTTTFAEMFELEKDTFIIDTPGIKELGLIDMEPEEISDNFPEMHKLRSDCKFGYRCMHLHEPGCAVIKAVQAGEIAPSRYINYVSMVEGEDNRK